MASPASPARARPGPGGAPERGGGGAAPSSGAPGAAPEAPPAPGAHPAPGVGGPDPDPSAEADSLVEEARAHGHAVDSPEDAARVRRALAVAAERHGAQRRDSGEPYWTHPVAVARILAALGTDADSLVVALLHDTVEDTDLALGDIEAEFGADAARLVDGVTKLGRLEIRAEHEETAENFRKLILAVSDDVRVLLVKLADRLHNMRTLSGIRDPARRRRFASETMDVFAPLAERIGLNRFRTELEELAFLELQPEAAESLRSRTASLRAPGEALVAETIGALRGALAEAGLEAEVSGRLKGIHSIWRKMQRRAVPFEQITDVMAFRVVVDGGPTECYAALGALHGRFPLVPGRFKDYISIPKKNGYRSLHTAVMGPGGRRAEVQIRDRDMHRVAEYGVAAHWHYKDAARRGARAGAPDSGGEWMSDLLELLEHAQTPEEFLEHTRMEMYRDQVFCFTPKGDLITLPRGANAIDFAYAIHSEVGHRCTGARVGGRLLPLRTELKNGDRVEVLQGAAPRPSPDWETLATTAKARSAVRRFIRNERRGEYERAGRAMLESRFRAAGLPFNEAALEAALGRWRLESVPDLYAQVGEGRVSPQEALNEAHPDARVSRRPRRVVHLADRVRRRGAGRQAPEGAVPLRGLIPGMAFHFARCCHPLPGERIVGIIVTGRGVTVHTLDCENLAPFQETPERWIDLSWEGVPGEERGGRSSRLHATILNRPGGLGGLCSSIGSQGGNILNLKIANRTADFFDVVVDVEVRDVDHLGAVVAALRGCDDVCSVERARG